MRSGAFDSLYRPDSVAVSLGASAAATVFSRAIGLIRGVALAWLIPQDEFGLLGVALLVANVLMPACGAGLYEGAARYAPFHESAGTLGRFVLRVSLLVLGISLAIGAILALLAGPVGSLMFSAGRLVSGSGETLGKPSPTIPLTYAVLACVVCLACYQTLLGLLKGLRMFRAVSAAELFSAVAFTGLAIGAAWLGYETARAVMVGYALSCAVAVIIFAPGLFARASRNVPESTERRVRAPLGLIRFSVWAGATAVTWHALSYYPMWYLLKVSDSETVGTFHAVRIITQLIQIGAVMLTAVVAANVNRIWEREGREVACAQLELLTKACLIALSLGATILLLARPVMMLMFPAKFAGGEDAYDPLVLFFLLVGVVGLVAVRLNLVEKPRSVFLAWIAGVVVNVVASFALLGPAGASGSTVGTNALESAAWAGVAGITVSLIVCVLLAGREAVALGRRSLALGLVAYSVGFGWMMASPIVAVIVVLSLTTQSIFTREERMQLRSRLTASTDR